MKPVTLRVRSLELLFAYCNSSIDVECCVQALSEQSQPLVRLLQGEYATALGADPLMSALYEQVISRHFGTGPSNAMGGLFSKMLEMLNGED